MSDEEEDDELISSSSCENEELSGQTETSSSDPNSKASVAVGVVDGNNNNESEAKDPLRRTERLQLRKYKKCLMEKYFQDEGSDVGPRDGQQQPQLIKWIESTAKFTPDKLNYSAWEMDKISLRGGGGGKQTTAAMHLHHHQSNTAHQFEELEAAEALAHLSFQPNLRQAV